MFEKKCYFINFSLALKLWERKYKTLNLNISTFSQNIKNLIDNFGAIYVENVHPKFQAFSLIC